MGLLPWMCKSFHPRSWGDPSLAGLVSTGSWLDLSARRPGSRAASPASPGGPRKPAHAIPPRRRQLRASRRRHLPGAARTGHTRAFSTYKTNEPSISVRISCPRSGPGAPEPKPSRFRFWWGIGASRDGRGGNENGTSVRLRVLPGYDTICGVIRVRGAVMAPSREELLLQLQRSKANCDASLLDRGLRAWGFDRSDTKKGHFYQHTEFRELIFTTHRPKGAVSPGAVTEAIRAIRKVEALEEEG